MLLDNILLLKIVFNIAKCFYFLFQQLIKLGIAPARKTLESWHRVRTLQSGQQFSYTPGIIQYSDKKNLGGCTFYNLLAFFTFMYCFTYLNTLTVNHPLYFTIQFSLFLWILSIFMQIKKENRLISI